MKVAAVVVTYNRKELLKKNICCLLSQQTDADLDIIVVDNASDDGTCEYISSYIEDGAVIYRNTGTNLGGAGGFQYGIRYAVENDYDFVWVMDDDCMPEKNTLDEFLKADKKLGGNYGFLSSKALWKDGNICKMNIQRKTLTKPLDMSVDELTKIAMASFVSLFIPVTVIRQAGLPIKEFFIWTDDWEFTRRISRKYDCYFVPHSVVVHESASNIGANIATDTPERLERYKLLYRNDVYLYRREGFIGFAYEVVRLSAHILRVMFKAGDNRLKRIRYILIGTKDGLSFNPDIEYVG